jgi:hypothetical protein
MKDSIAVIIGGGVTKSLSKSSVILEPHPAYYILISKEKDDFWEASN